MPPVEPKEKSRGRRTVKRAVRQGADKPSAFKHQVNEGTARRLARALEEAYPAFDATGFVRQVRQQIAPLELKARIALLSHEMATRLPEDYPQALPIVLSTLGPELQDTKNVAADAFYHWVHGHFVETRGLGHFGPSLAAMLEITKRSTAEFAVRPFLQADPERVLRFLRRCLRDPNPHVRRFVSEGTRSRLPWGMRLRAFQADPSAPLELLEALKNDESRYVRTSVANHLGDVAKDHPERVVATVARWIAEGGPHAPWIAQRALRHLVKQGHAGALAVLGASRQTSVRSSKLSAAARRIHVGEQLAFRFDVVARHAERVVIDYAIDYRLASGKLSRKVYKLKTLDLETEQRLELRKSHSFRPITTRRYHPGRHRLEIVVNGVAQCGLDFELVEA